MSAAWGPNPVWGKRRIKAITHWTRVFFSAQIILIGQEYFHPKCRYKFLKKQPFTFFGSRFVFPNFRNANKCINQSRWLCETRHIRQQRWLTGSFSVSLTNKMHITQYKLSHRHPKTQLEPAGTQFHIFYVEVRPPPPPLLSGGPSKCTGRWNFLLGIKTFFILKSTMKARSFFFLRTRFILQSAEV